MPAGNNNGTGLQVRDISGAQIELGQSRQKQLDLLGGEDLRGSGFEDEEPEVESGEEG